MQQQCILVGELVVWSDRTLDIVPFYKIRRHVNLAHLRPAPRTGQPVVRFVGQDPELEHMSNWFSGPTSGLLTGGTRIGC